MFLGVSIFGNAQSIESMQVKIYHLGHCTDLEKLSLHVGAGIPDIKHMIDFNKGLLRFPEGSEDAKAELQSRVTKLEAEYSTYDLSALKNILLRKNLEIVRNLLSECADTYQDKSAVSVRLLQIGGILEDLSQTEDAIPIYRRCLALDPDFAPCSESIGMAFLTLGRRPEARDAFKRTIEIGGFSEWNSKYIGTAKQMLEMMNQEDENSKDVTGTKEATSMQHTYGTGFFITSDGEILTNNHVVAGCHNLTILGGMPVQIISRDPASDLALVKADHKPDQVAVFRSGPAPRIGDTVVTFGFPLPGILSSEGNVATGILSATTGLQNDIRYVQISAPVQPGNSGGPVFDTSGHIVGVVVAKLDALRIAQFTGDVPQNVNFAVHWSEVRALLDEQGVRYKKLPSLQAIGTRAIAKIGAEISVTLDCVQ
jgi:S1-C subfamily serine protease